MRQIMWTDLAFDCPRDWQDQGVMTFVLPSPDPRLNPNIIVTKERLPKRVPLDVYAQRVKGSLLRRDLPNLTLERERRIEVGDLDGIEIVCSWDVDQLQHPLAPPKPPPWARNRVVKQVLVMLMRGSTIINVTGSFPEELFDDYARSFELFVARMMIVPRRRVFAHQLH